MTILQVCYFVSKVPGNFIYALKDLEDKITNEGNKVIYAFPEPAKDTEWCKEIQERTNVYFLPYEGALKNINTYKTLRKIYIEHNVDIVHAHHDVYDFPVTLMGLKKMKIVIHLHNALPYNYWNNSGLIRKLKYFIGRRIYKKVNVISVSNHNKLMVSERRFPEKNISVIPNGIVLSRIYSSENKDKKYDFLTFVSDFYGKGGDGIIEACKILEDEGYKFNILFCGGGREDGWKDLDMYIGESVSRPSWLETKDVVDDISELYNVSKTFISASRRETFSLAICEAAYAGMQVISSDIEGVKWAKELPTVKFFNDGDWIKLYEIMKEVLDNNVSITNEKINNSKLIIEKKYNIDKWVNEIIYIYNNTN